MERQNLRDFFIKHRTDIVETWFEAMLNIYPPETVRIFQREKDPFANPVGHNLHTGIEGILDWLGQEKKEIDVSLSLDKIIRIWAVQDFTPSQTISFLIDLKQIIKKQMKKHDKNQDQMGADWQVFDAEVDHLMLLAMDIYTQCREKLYQIKVDEAHKRVYSLLRKSNVLADFTESTTDASDSCDTCDSCETDKQSS